MAPRHVHVHIGRLVADSAADPRLGDDALQRMLAGAITRRLEGRADEGGRPATVIDEIARAVTHAVQERSAMPTTPAATAATEVDHGRA